MMIKLSQKQKEKIRGFSEEFRQKYLESEKGKDHIQRYLNDLNLPLKLYTTKITI